MDHFPLHHNIKCLSFPPPRMRANQSTSLPSAWCCHGQLSPWWWNEITASRTCPDGKWQDTTVTLYTLRIYLTRCDVSWTLVALFWLRRGGGREHGELAAGLARLANLTLAALSSSGNGIGAAQTLYGFMTRVKFPVSKQWCLDTIMSLTVFVRPFFFIFYFY